MTYYQDEIEKLKYLRNRIASSLVMSGNYPDRDTIDKRLEAVDAKLALFQHVNAKESTGFDVDAFNEEFLALYEDLLIIYKLVYKFRAERYEETKAYIETHLSSLEAMAKQYKQKTEFESGATAIGETIFFKSDGFVPKTNNYITSLNLGNIKVNKGSKISFLVKGKHFSPQDVSIKLGDLINIQRYAENDYTKVPGKSSYKEYTCEFPQNIKRNSMFILNNMSFSPDQRKKYIVYGGKNHFAVKDDFRERFVEKKESTPITMSNKSGRITFYIIGGTYINFDFSKAPLTSNFYGYSIQNLESHQKITFEYEAPFSFDYVTDGIVYATKKEGIVQGAELYYPDADNLREFRIEEYAGDDTISLPFTIMIEQKGEKEPQVTMVAVKELSILDEVQP